MFDSINEWFMFLLLEQILFIEQNFFLDETDYLSENELYKNSYHSYFWYYSAHVPHIQGLIMHDPFWRIWDIGGCYDTTEQCIVLYWCRL